MQLICLKQRGQRVLVDVLQVLSLHIYRCTCHNAKNVISFSSNIACIAVENSFRDPEVVYYDCFLIFRALCKLSIKEVGERKYVFFFFPIFPFNTRFCLAPPFFYIDRYRYRYRYIAYFSLAFPPSRRTFFSSETGSSRGQGAGQAADSLDMRSKVLALELLLSILENRYLLICSEVAHSGYKVVVRLAIVAIKYTPRIIIFIIFLSRHCFFFL